MNEIEFKNERVIKMSKKIVAIGGGENGRLGSDGTRKPYETAEIDKEIIRLTGKEKPNFLLLAHAQLTFGYEREKRYYDTMKKIYGDLYKCECRWLTVEELKTNFAKAVEDVSWADIIYEGGGDTSNMIKFWKETGFDKLLKKAWEDGKVMCGVSAGAICWFNSGFTDSPDFVDKEINKVNALDLVDAYFTPHAQIVGKMDKVRTSLKYIDKVGISLSNCTAIEVIDDQYRIIKSKPNDNLFIPYALKTYWENGELYEEEISSTEIFKSLNELLSKNLKLKDERNMNLFLREIEDTDKKEIEEMALEFKNANDEYPFEGVSDLKKVLEQSFEEFYNNLEINKHIDEINPNYANQTTYVLVDENNHIYGMANLRHELKGKLFEIGGHVGYAIRPSERGKGYGTIQLKLLIKVMNEMGIEKALITCRENNIGSKKTMEKFIGESDTLVPSMYEGIMEYRYWIDVNKNLNNENALKLK